MDTTKQQVLLMAPELRSFVRNKRQVDTVTISVLKDATVYTISVDGVLFSHTSGTPAVAADIAAGLVTEINNGTTNALATDNGDGTFTITSKDATYPVYSDVDLDHKLVVTLTAAAFLGEELFNQILIDVKKACKEDRFKDEQEQAQRLLAAHILTALKIGSGTSLVSSSSVPVGSTIVEEKVGDVTLKYNGALNPSANDDSGLTKTKYGKLYLDLIGRCKVWYR